MQQRHADGHQVSQQGINHGIPFANDVRATDGRCHHLVQSYAEVGQRSSLDRRLLAVRVRYQQSEGRVYYSFFAGVCHHEPLTTTERSALLLLFPFAPDGTHRDILEPTLIFLNGYDYTWYWCAHIVAADAGVASLPSMCVSEFLMRIDAYDKYLATGNTHYILALIVQEVAYKGYFCA